MTQQLTPRRMVKSMVQGIAPPRPLFLPIVFSLGARVENLSQHEFLGNATKVSNALRQIRGHLRSDGVACTFDPWLEAEALGGEVMWETASAPPAIRWPRSAKKGELPEGLRSPEDAAESGRIPVGVEVIRRLKALLQDEPVLMAGVAGPFTLAAHLLQLDNQGALRREHFSEAALEIAAATIRHAAVAFAEAGADLIFIREEILPVFSAADGEAWASLLTPLFNSVRFYEALPVLQIGSRSLADQSEFIRGRSWDAVLCLPLDAVATRQSEILPGPTSAAIGIALPAQAFQPEGSGGAPLEELCRTVVNLQPAVLTTITDLPATTDMKRLREFYKRLTASFAVEAATRPSEGP